MEFKEWIQNAGLFLTAKTIKEMPDKKAVGVIINTPILLEKNIKGENVWKLQMALEINEEHYVFDMGKRDAKEIAKVYGDELQDWVGKKLSLTVIPTSLGASVYAVAVEEVEAGAKSSSSPFSIKYYHNFPELENNTHSSTNSEKDVRSSPKMKEGVMLDYSQPHPHIPFYIQKNLKEMNEK